MIENIAQTCAARIGYVNKYILKKGIQIGVIAAVRDLKFLAHPKADFVFTSVVSGESVKAKVNVMKGDTMFAQLSFTAQAVYSRRPQYCNGRSGGRIQKKVINIRLKVLRIEKLALTLPKDIPLKTNYLCYG